MTEKLWTDRLTAALKAAGLLYQGHGSGWFVGHDRDSRGQSEGEPDLMALWVGPAPPPDIVPGRFLFLELKTASGKPSAAQLAFHAGCVAACIPCYLVVVPRDSGAVEMLFGLPPGAIDVRDPDEANAAAVARLQSAAASRQEGRGGVSRPAAGDGPLPLDTAGLTELARERVYAAARRDEEARAVHRGRLDTEAGSRLHDET